MMNPYLMTNFLIPKLPANNDMPPTIYQILNSIANYGKDEEDITKMKNLAKVGREKIFDFEYPLTSLITKEEFEVNILNRFMLRRIGFDTVSVFSIMLGNKLNDIMPKYNIMFESVKNWNLFSDGETETRNVNVDNTLNSQTTSDRRNSELPQSEIDNVKNASYLTDYNYDQNLDSSTGNSKTVETINRSQKEKTQLYLDFQNELKSIYSLIYKDLDCLFYQICG